MESRGAESKGSSELLIEVTFTCGAKGKPTRLNIAVPAAFPREPGASALCPRTGMAALRLALVLVRMKTSPRQEIQLVPLEDLSTQLASPGTRRVT